MPEIVLMGSEHVDADKAVVNIRSHAFNYGTSVFEGIRAYWSSEEQELLVFRLPEHLERLQRSAKILHMKLPSDLPDILDRCLNLLRLNNYKEDVYLRPIVYKGVPPHLGVDLAEAPDEFLAYSFPQGKYLPTQRALRATISSWQRIQDNAAPARGKIGGTYVNPALAKTEAAANGFDECIMLTSQGNVAEGSTSNLFIFDGHDLITPPSTEDILVGITRSTLMQIAQNELGINVVERTVDRSELYGVEEAFFCGTGAEIAGIGEIDGRNIGNGEIGEVTLRLQSLYTQVTRGQLEKYRNWCTPVYQSASLTIG